AMCDPVRGCSRAQCVPGSTLCDGSSVLECTDGTATDSKNVDCGSASRCSPGIGCTHGVSLGAGEAHSCVILGDAKAVDGDPGFIECWGANESGQLGNGSSVLGDSLEPRYVVFYPGGDMTQKPLAISDGKSV